MEAMVQGRLAWRYDEARDTNPYAYGTTEYKQWDWGFVLEGLQE